MEANYKYLTVVFLFLYQMDNRVDDFTLSADYRWIFVNQNYQNYNSHRSKLTQLHANEIRTKYLPNIYGKRKLAKEYKVSVALITKIIDRKIWNA